MEEVTTFPVKKITTFAHISSTEEVHFYGELAESYAKSFIRYKNEASIIELSAGLSFLAENGFKGYTPDNFQKVDLARAPGKAVPAFWSLD